MTYKVKLEIFEGPLDLLLYLIRKNEIDIYDIPIVTITQQYMEYLELMKALNLEIAGEFLVMAATLMHIKSRSLLPHQEEMENEEGPDPFEELRRQLIEYQKYKDVAQLLKEQKILEKDVFKRSFYEVSELQDGEPSFDEVNLFDLLNALKSVLKKSTGDTLMEVTAEQISVKDKITEILENLRSKRTMTFDSLFTGLSTRLEIISTFLALLELIKLQAVRVLQQAPFRTIHIYSIEEALSSDEPVPYATDEIL
ncbi:MAG: segregation/condensation protein A [Proteobacteria bacterium]|nr:segregation/condensation protein A [Pseudomonadota bacterium]